MSKKIQYMRDVPHHGNIVKFIGEVDEGGAEGQTTFIYVIVPVPTTMHPLSRCANLAVDLLNVF